VITTSIRQRVRDNLNRDDSGIDTKIQDWINDTKRRIEQRIDMDYMRVQGSLTFAAGAQTATLPARFKHEIDVQIRKTVPVAEREIAWTKFPRVSEAEILRIQSYDTAGVLIREDPSGYTLTETTMVLHPQPEATDTWVISMPYFEFSADWTFGVSEEPYLAKFAHQAVIDGATALGYAFLGQLGDEGKWEEKFEKKYMEFAQHENKRALEGDWEFRPNSGANNRRPSRTYGWSI